MNSKSNLLFDIYDLISKRSYHSLMRVFLNNIKVPFKEWNPHHRTPLMRWSLHKYKCLLGVGGKGWGSSLQEGVSHTYTLKLNQSRISIMYKKKGKKNEILLYIAQINILLKKEKKKKGIDKHCSFF